MTSQHGTNHDTTNHDTTLAFGLRSSGQVLVHTRFGRFAIQAFVDEFGHTHLALWRGIITDVNGPPLVRLQSACVTSTALNLSLCDCADQLTAAFVQIEAEDRGVILYLDQEGRGHGLFEKVVTMAAMVGGATTVSAFTNRGLPADVRSFGAAIAMLDALGVGPTVRLLTNNPAKIKAVCDGGRKVDRISLWIEPTETTRRYLECKRADLGHLE